MRDACSTRSSVASGQGSRGSLLPELATPVSHGQRSAAFEGCSYGGFLTGPCNRTVSAVKLDIMRVTIQLPEDISAALEEQWDDVPRRSLEAIAVEGYRTGALTESQVRRLLELGTRFQVHALLKEHHVPLQYTSADIEDDLRAHRELGILPGQ